MNTDANPTTHYPVDRPRLAAAFRTLRKAGYVAKRHFWCCSTCGHHALRGTAKYVFLHQQAETSMRHGYPAWLAWQGDGAEIAKALSEAGLVVIWNGTHEMKVGAMGLQRVAS